MRSVVVVFPASMCAEMPMFRYRSMGVARATDAVPSASPQGEGSRCLPAVVSEGLVGLSHAMGILALAHGGTTVIRGIHQLVREAKRHRLLAAVPSRLDDPAHSQCLAAGSPNFNGDLVSGATDAARFHFHD